MLPGWGYTGWDLVQVYYDAPRRLRAMAAKGILEKRRYGKIVKFVKTK
jgi:hypothetical protein